MNDQDQQAYLYAFANAMKQHLPDGVGFTIQLFKLNENEDTGLCNYISTADRGDIIKMFRDGADQLERDKNLN